MPDPAAAGGTCAQIRSTPGLAGLISAREPVRASSRRSTPARLSAPSEPVLTAASSRPRCGPHTHPDQLPFPAARGWAAPAACEAVAMTESGRKLVLLRHAKSAWPDVPDHDRPLAGRGRRNAPVMGRWLRTNGYVPDRVLCSTARRARETWRLAEEGLAAAPPVSFERRVYQASAVQLLDLVRGVPSAVTTLLIVGHDPAIS